MAKAIIASGGGGGAGSDECTATKNDVVQGFTAITSESDDEPIEGTLVDRGDEEVTDLVHVSETSRIHAYLEPGAYRTPVESHSGRHLVHILFSSIRDVLGLTAEKIANGVSIAGITGNYKGRGDAMAEDVVAGKKFSTASLDNATGTLTERGTYDVTDVVNNASRECINVYLETGAYRTKTSSHSNRHPVWIPYENLNNAIGLTADDLWPGKTIAGVESNKSSMAGQTITPKASQQTISCSGKAMTGNIVVAGDADLAAKNIRNGANIFGVSGSADGWFDSDTNILRDSVFGGWGFEVVTGTIYSNGESVRSNKPKVQTSRQIDFSYYSAVNLHTTNHSSDDNWSYRAKVTLLDTGQSYTSEYQKPQAGATATFNVPVSATGKSRISVEIEHSHTGKIVAITTIWLSTR